MPTPPMTPKAQAAYQEALRRIETCRHEGKDGSYLDLCGLGLTQVPPEIGQLCNIKGFYVTSNNLTTLPPEIGQLASLEDLFAFDNEITTLPPEIGELKKLQKLWINRNRLSRLPPEVGQLKELTELLLYDNNLVGLPLELTQLGKLRELYLHGNVALGIPPAVLGAQWDYVLDSIAEPEKVAESIAKGESTPDEYQAAQPREILDYYFETRGQDGRALREVKVILVGRGEVGKSTMVEVLGKKKFVRGRARTDGIAITPWPVTLPDGQAELALWDFGGQEIMHGTHQFFLTHRSLYVVMVDGRHDRGRQDAEYWLKMVRAFGGDSPVLVVMNRQKAHPFDVDREVLAKKYGVALEHFFRTDCETAKTIQPLRAAIQAEAARMLAAEERFPARCWNVKTRLAQMKQHGEDYLSDQSYQNLCVQFDVTEEADQQSCCGVWRISARWLAFQMMCAWRRCLC